MSVGLRGRLFYANHIVPGKQIGMILIEPLFRTLIPFRHRVLQNGWQEIKQKSSVEGENLNQTGFQERKKEKKCLKDPLSFRIFSQGHLPQYL